MSKERFGIRSVAVTSAGLLAVGFVLLHLRGMQPARLFDSPYSASLQVLLAAGAGAALALGQLLLVRVWPGWRRYTVRAVSGLTMPFWQVLVVALMVAIAEELAYRAALQPLTGLWVASALFTLAHVRLDRAAWAQPDRPYAIAAVGLLYAISMAMGLLFMRVGLLAAMTAHFAYDLILLHGYVRLGRNGAAEGAREAPDRSGLTR